MPVSGIIYYASLLVCVSLGDSYKNIADLGMKRNYGTGLGLLLVCLICGAHALHSVAMVAGNVVVIKCCDRRYMNQISLIFTWMHLWYMHINVTNIYVIWLHQTIALKLVGLGFEMCAVQITGEGIALEPSAVDIISYAYFFIGLHRGPYYRWKVFDEHFNAPFSELGGCKECRAVTEGKLKKAIMCALCCWLLRLKYSKDFYFTDAFYNKCSGEARYLYNAPHLVSHLLQRQATMMLCTSVFTQAGFGMFPAKCNPLPGFGPSARPSVLAEASGSKAVVLQEAYSFAMIKCFDNEAVVMGPKMRDTMRGWDMPTRYWFWAYTQKAFLKSNREVRSAFSLLAWTIWSEPTIPRCILGCTLWAHVHLEAEYVQLYGSSDGMKLPWNIGFSVLRLLCLLYLTPCLVLQSTSAVLRFYCSIFWVFHIILLLLMLFSVYLYKTRVQVENQNLL